MPSLDQVLFQFSGQDVTLNQLLVLPIALLLGYFLLNFLALLVLRSMTKRGTNPDLVQVTRRLLNIAVLLVITLIALQILKVPLTAFAFISGAVAIGVGFGAQNIINNFISGWIVIWERPIRINDFIEVSGVQGSVQEINTRSTRLKRP
ncbi:mechanosensitive ion channel, partial [Pseudomonadales bacterium]|nr:mechanosensitive ion channel [Pseudomonadales bacterium]